MFRSNFTLIFLLFALFGPASAQTFEWARLIDFHDVNQLVNSQGDGRAVALSASGDIYAIGSYNGDGDFDPGPGEFLMSTSVQVNGFVVKLTAAGDLQWAAQIDGASAVHTHSISVDPNGAVYVCGWFTGGPVDFDPGPGQQLLSGEVNSQSGFLWKLSSDGTLVWARIFTGPTAQAHPRDMCFDPQGNVILIGNFEDEVDFDPGPGTFQMSSVNGTAHDGFICSLSPSGDLVAACHIPTKNSSYESLRSVVGDQGGSVYVTGAFTDSCDVDPGANVVELFPVNGNTSFLLKLSSDLAFQWVIQLPGGSPLPSIALNDQGALLVTGRLMGSFDMDPTANSLVITTPDPNGDGAFIARYTGDASVLWAKVIGGTSASDVASLYVASDDLGEVIMAGSFSGLTDFDPGIGVFELGQPGDLFILKLTSAGEFVYAGNYRAVAPATDFSNGLTVDGPGNIFLVGSVGDNNDMDPAQDIYDIQATVRDAYVLRLCHDQPVNDDLEITAPSSVCAGASFTLSIPLDQAAQTYSWTLPTGWVGSSTTNVIEVTPYEVGTGVVYVSAANDCSEHTFQAVVEVLAPSNFSYTIDSMVVSFNMLDPECATSGEGFMWDYGNGTQNTIAQSPVWTYQTPGSYSVCLVCNYSNCPVCTVITVPGQGSGSTAELTSEENGPVEMNVLSLPGRHFRLITDERVENMVLANSLGQLVPAIEQQHDASGITFSVDHAGLYFLIARIGGRSRVRSILAID